MNIVTKCVLALTGASLVVAYACANPVEIIDDVIRVDPDTFGDGGVVGGASGLGGSAGAVEQGGSGGTAGTTGGTAGTGGTSTGGGGTGGTGAGTGGTGAGTGGTAGTGAGTGGAAGTGGVAGSAGSAGSAGTAGTGNTAVFDADSCDFVDTAGCEALACATACPANMGNYCEDACTALITCVSTDAGCTITEADPLCAARVNNQDNVCTAEANTAGGAAQTQPTSPAFIARSLVNCLCSVPRPN